MEANKVFSKEGLKWKCREHANAICEIICLNGDAQDRVMCFYCAQKQQIPFSNLLSMSQVLAANDRDILEAYPPLKDPDLLSRLRSTSIQQQLDQIEGYFKQLREDFEKEVQAAQKRAKESLIYQDNAYHELVEGYQKIAEVDKLKELIVSEKESAEKDLDSFIKEKWNKANENRKIIADLINQYESEQYFQSDKANRIAQEIISSLKNINFYQRPLQRITLIKSTYRNSQAMEITKVNELIHQARQVTQNGYYDQVFIDPILNPQKKYIVQIELEQKPGTSKNYFFFGIVKDEGKDNNPAYNQNMCYDDNSNSRGITKYIKGSPMQSSSNVTGKHSFEIRIDLNQQILRVASLPDYSSIAELDDPSKIDPNISYRFFFSMLCQGDMVRILNFKTVSKFDDKM